MGYLSPKELTLQYAGAGAVKAKRSAAELFILAILAGALIALGSAATNTASFGVADVGLARTICGLLFPFGLCMVVVTGAELFTGNCLITISVLEKKATAVGMLRNWVIVYLGNLLGALLVAAGCAYFGQFDYGSGALAVYTIKIAVGKCGIGFGKAVVFGILCNLLVSLGVLLAMSSKDTAGRLMGAFIPVSFFVICGFEHCVANMYYIPAGMMAASNPVYAALAVEDGLDLSVLTMGNFVVTNLLPVTIGNIIGGGGLGALMWFSHVCEKEGAKA